MSLECKGGTTRATCCPKGEHLPHIDRGFQIYLQVSPQETEERFIFFQQANLVEHPFDITADGDGMFPESKEDSQQASSQSGPRQEMVIRALALECEGANEDYTVFPIVAHSLV